MSDNSIHRVLVLALLRLDFPARFSKLMHPGAEPQADAIVDGVEVVDLPVALQNLDDPVKLGAGGHRQRVGTSRAV